MKELSIEDKAKRYDEAIKVAQRFYNNSAAITKKGLEDIFPELAESDDEKVRKEILEFFSQFENGELRGVDISSWIAYLKKQGEKGINGKNREIPFSKQKPVEQKFVNNKFKMTKSKKQIILLTQQEGNNEIAFATDSLIHAKNMLALGLAYINELINEDDKESVIPNGNFLSNYFPLEPWSDEQTKRNLINFLKSLGATEIPQASLNRYLTYLEKQGEKNVIIPKFRVGDVIRRKGSEFTRTITSIFENKTYITGKGTTAYGIKIEEQDDWELVEQKSAWSEEDDDNLSWLVEMLLGFDGNDIECYKDKKFIDKCKEVCKWLKAIKDRTSPQPKQEWGEEDEKYLIYNIEQDYRDKLNNNPSESLRPYYNKVISLLKSIRHQKQWKPSDEQIEILDMVLTNESMDDNVARILRELREQLKKLMEE